jgi:hypothetical protein
MLLLACTHLATAVDLDSFRFSDHLSGIVSPGAPELFEDAVIFTAASPARRVGVSFAHEGFARVHWFRKLLKPDAGLDAETETAAKAGDEAGDEVGDKAGSPAAAKPVSGGSSLKDTGILCYVYEFPRGLAELEYRLVVDGLWTADPRNPFARLDPVSGLVRSVVSLPPDDQSESTVDDSTGSLRFSYRGAPGLRVSVGGSFNSWDPFMYELDEVAPGRYALALPLPPGTYRYVYFLRGERILDPNNPRKVYTAEGKAVSEAFIQ